MVSKTGTLGENVRITLNKLEALLAEESDKFDELRVFSSVSPDVYALLYVVAREGFTDVVDALMMARHCGKLMSFITDRMLTPDDLESALIILHYLCSDDHWSISHYPALAVLLNWCTRTVENQSSRWRTFRCQSRPVFACVIGSMSTGFGAVNSAA